MDATSSLAPLASSLTGPPSPALAALAVAVCAVCAFLAARRGWPVAFRRAIFCFLLYALLALGAGVLPPELLASWRPVLLVTSRLLAWIGIVEFAQGLIVDLALVGWLRRPPAPRILRDFVTLALALTFFLLTLRGALGVNLSSLLATSAMISVVLGLALQDTLGGFFAGLALQMEAPLAIGDWVQIGEHQGRVAQVSWRTVRLVNLESDEVTLPNSLLTRSTLVNYSRPTTAHQSSVPVRVHYRHPPNEVIAALVEAIRETPGVLQDPPFHALVWEYGDSEIVYRARYWIDDFRRVNHVRSAVAARIWYRLCREGIEPGHPVRILRTAAPAADGSAAEPQAAVALRAVDLFDPLSEAERLLLSQRLRPLLFGRGETVIRQGAGGDSLFVVTRGRVEVRVASAGEERLVGTLQAGSFFGEMSLLTGEPRTATVVALEDTEVLPVAREDFRRVVAANPAVLEAVTRLVADRRGRLAEAIRETEEAAAARSAAHCDLLERVRSFFGV